MNWKDLVIITGMGFGAYVVGSYLIFRELEARSYFELIGYINGLIRGAGSKSEAIMKLADWTDYWLNRKPYLRPIILSIWNYGLSRIWEEYRE